MQDRPKVNCTPKVRHVKQIVYNERGAYFVSKIKKYDFKIKQIVIEDLKTNILSFREAEKKYNIGHSIIARWEKIYSKEGIEGLFKEKGRKIQADIIKTSPKDYNNKGETDLFAENQRLRMENEYLKKLNALIQKKDIFSKETKHK